MDNRQKKPDRLNVSQNAQEVIDRIDEKNFFGLGKESISRSELFLFAMALGVDTLPTKLENVHTGGLILDKSIDSATLASVYALLIAELGEDKLDGITNKQEVYRKAQEYANTGFLNLEDYLQKYSPDDLAWTLLSEMEEQYQTILG